MAQAEAALAEPISADICIRTEDLSVEGRLERTGPEMYSFTVTAPTQLEGFSLRFAQRELQLGYRGMELELDPDVFPGSFALGSFNEMLDDLLRQEDFSLANTEDGGGILSGKVSGKDFELTLDPQCSPKRFYLPDEDITLIWTQKTAS